MGGFFPGKKFGGPPVSVDNFCSLMKGNECFIVTLNHDLFDVKPFTGISKGWNDRGNCKVKYLCDNEYKKEMFEKVITDIQPDIIYLQGLFQKCIVPCLQLAKKYHIHVLLAPRGELCEGALNIKKYKKVPYIFVLRMLGLVNKIHFQSTSNEETEAIQSWLKANVKYIHLLDNIPSIPKITYQKNNKKSGEGKFIFLSRIHPKKNLLNAISYFRGAKGKALFDIYGPIEDVSYWDECQKEIGSLPKNVKVEYKGLVNHDGVHDVFSQYDAFLFPTLSENYGHVIAESLSVGTPVIISDQTPWRQLKATGVGWDISLNQSEDFTHAINAVVEMNDTDYNLMRKNAIKFINEKFSIERLKEQYINALYSVIKY